MRHTNLLLAKVLCLFLCMASFSSSQAYTAFMVKSGQGVVTGRNLDYNQTSIYNTKTYKIGETIVSVLGNFTWNVNYDFITINNVLSDPANYLVAFEGMNKAGISISGNLADADHPHDIPAPAPTLSSDDIVRYVLSLASSISDAKSLFSMMNISSKWKYHYIVFDKAGNSLVVEFKNGTVKYYENVTKILTNNPDLNYQIANLNNYANLKNYNPNSITPESGDEFHGAGMNGLPGDWMSPSRFIRGYFMISEGEKYVSTSDDAINLASRILDSVCLIKGIDLGKSPTSKPIYTQIQIIKDVNNNTVYMKKYDDFQWTQIHY